MTVRRTCDRNGSGRALTKRVCDSGERAATSSKEARVQAVVDANRKDTSEKKRPVSVAVTTLHSAVGRGKPRCPGCGGETPRSTPGSRNGSPQLCLLTAPS